MGKLSGQNPGGWRFASCRGSGSACHCPRPWRKMVGIASSSGKGPAANNMAKR